MPRSSAAARPGSVGAIRNDDGDLGVETVFGDGVGDGQEIRASAGEEDAEALHLYMTRGAAGADHFADFVPRALSACRGSCRPFSHRRARDDEDHADAEIEGAAPIGFGDVADFAQEIEDRQHGPGSDLDSDAEPFRQNARSVVGDASAGDVGGAFEYFLVVQRAQRRQIAAMEL